VLSLKWRRAAGIAALAAPILMWSEFLSMGLSRHGYNLLTRPFSDLATRGTQNATIFDLGFFLVPGVLSIILGLGMALSIRGGQAWRAGAALVVGAGVFQFATGIFQQDPTSFVAGALHGTMAQICFALASVAPLVLFLGSRDHAHLSPPRRIWMMAGIASFAIEGIALAIHPLVHYPDGLFQRPFTLVLTIFFVTTGAWLLRARGVERQLERQPA
jgi:hypothetical membrane protein